MVSCSSLEFEVSGGRLVISGGSLMASGSSLELEVSGGFW